MKYLSLLLIVIIFIFSSCENIPMLSLGKKEGTIKYKITYLDTAAVKNMLDLLPSTMNYLFKDDNTKIKIGVGIFSSAYISNIDKAISITLLKIMYVRYLYEEKISEKSVLFENIPGMKVDIKENETKKIAGYKCQKATISFPGTDKKPYDVYFTKKIKIKNPNQNNPYKEIDGVLLDFQLKLLGLDMRFTADSVNFNKVKEDEFEIPKDYKKVNKPKIEETLNSLKAMLL